MDSITNKLGGQGGQHSGQGVGGVGGVGGAGHAGGAAGNQDYGDKGELPTPNAPSTEDLPPWDPRRADSGSLRQQPSTCLPRSRATMSTTARVRRSPTVLGVCSRRRLGTYFLFFSPTSGQLLTWYFHHNSKKVNPKFSN